MRQSETGVHVRQSERESAAHVRQSERESAVHVRQIETRVHVCQSVCVCDSVAPVRQSSTHVRESGFHVCESAVHVCEIGVSCARGSGWVRGNKKRPYMRRTGFLCA